MSAIDPGANAVETPGAPLAEPRAFVLRPRRGEPQLLEEPLAALEPKQGEVLVRVMAAGLSSPSLAKPSSKDEPRIPGSDAAGVVWSVGASVSRWKIGDEVVVHPSVTCGTCSACTGFDRAPCHARALWGVDAKGGAYADLALVQSAQLVRKPAHLTWEEAASYGASYFTAYRALVDRAKVRPGEGVLVWGAGGALGAFAVQVAGLLGARVVAVGSSDERLALAARFHPSMVLDRRAFPSLEYRAGETRAEAKTREGATASFVEEVRAALDGKLPDVVFDAFGDRTLPASVAVASQSGRIVLAGAAAPSAVALDVARVWTRELAILGSHFVAPEECQRANELVTQRKIAPVLTETFPRDRLTEGLATRARGEHAGALAVLLGARRLGAKTFAEARNDEERARDR